jgi:D-alanine-D-alanine ligase
MPATSDKTRVLVLAGGPDAERQVSITSAGSVARALRANPVFEVQLVTIERLTAAELRAIAADVVVPVLHGGWGEGGPLQDILEADGRPFVFSGARASRLAMDKIATKMAALACGIATPASHVLDLRDGVCPLPFPVIVKPIHEGSTVGLHVVRTEADWRRAIETIRSENRNDAQGAAARSYMIEPMVTGAGGGRARELTVGVLDAKALPIIEITPASGLYDYEAKYHRDDTVYTLDPELPPGVAETITQQAEVLTRRIGARHVARADFMLDGSGTAWLLEINTIPGFTDHSLVPKAARHAGIDMPELCARLVRMALRDRA